MNEKIETYLVKERWINFILDLQNQICEELAAADGKTFFVSDKWDTGTPFR